ncbi:MAG: DNA-binding transcriptional regulator [Castellaniella sp.]|uniref:helix-turn-helix domain-containing protein n=1 Tax=Castellaniella sp. TaxID=1955812 RepID=UPI002A36E7ED|nr:DNA-binding transcriptional regulator [Castellaniella sp.]MDY0310122.1 DNA-binding transcriptional regulator [Castellaniella sp.]
MTTKPRFKSDAFEAIHSAATGLHRGGVVTKQTMRDFDAMCLAAAPQFDAKAVVQIRKDAQVSQSVFARYLNTSTSTVQKWESGAKQPSGVAARLLQVVKKHGLDVLA